MMQKINWGIIGCGDVTEVKSGPAFNKVADSALVAVMRRDSAKAADYARRHAVPAWYDDAAKLIRDPRVDAVYVATPPDTHELYTLAAMAAGKPVYVEKPMTLDSSSARRLVEESASSGVKLVVAHYRRAQPMFNKIKHLLDEGSIGKVTKVNMKYASSLPSAQELLVPKMAWRLDPATSGGGLFHDLAPHQLGLMLFFFGAAKSASGTACNKGGLYPADDTVTGSILFADDILFSGAWDFAALKGEEVDECVITGTDGEISFAVFGHYHIQLRSGQDESVFHFEPLQHVQQPMIAKVVQYFLGNAPNPCPPGEGYEVMKLIEAFTAR